MLRIAGLTGADALQDDLTRARALLSELPEHAGGEIEYSPMDPRDAIDVQVSRVLNSLACPFPIPIVRLGVGRYRIDTDVHVELLSSKPCGSFLQCYSVLFSVVQCHPVLHS